MKKIYLVLSLLTVLMFSYPGFSAIFQVPSVYTTIQDGIDASFNGDTVLVDPGTYYEHLNLGGKNIVLCSKYLTTGDPAYIGTTILDGSNTGRVITISSGEDSTCLVAGFTIRNGNSAFEPGLTYGGGLLINESSPVVRNCIIENCSAPAYGGGVALYGFGSSAKVRDCVIRNNTADSFGGGLFMGDCTDEAEVANCIITGNTITCSCNFGGGGGGVNLYHKGKLVNCLVTYNSAPNATAGGGGICCDWGDYYGTQGIFVTGSTIAYNTAYFNGGVSDIINGGEFRNCIIWGNTDGSNNVSNIAGNSYQYTCSDPQPWGTGNIYSDPLFLNAGQNNFRLSAASPCINAGNGLFNMSATDLDGNPRVENIIDMGAYEFGSMLTDTVQVGSGTDLTDLFPLYTCYDYNYSQQIYLGSEITSGGGAPGFITKIRFRYAGGASNPAAWNQWTVYLGNTVKTEFSGVYDWVPSTAMTQVFSGNIPEPVYDGWLEISFNTPFYYSGDNIVVAVDENTYDWDCSASWYSFDSGADRGLLFTSTWQDPDPSSPPDANWYPSATLSQVQFAFSNSHGHAEGFVYRQTSCTEPVAGATVSSGTYSTTTDIAGFYRLLLPAGTYLDLTANDGSVSQTQAPVFITGGDTTLQNFCLPIYFPPPVQLEAEVTGPAFNNVHLSWLAPGSIEDQWIYWGTGVLAGSLGYGNTTMTFSVASRWPVSDIAPYDGTYLKKVKFYPAEGTANYTVKVWKGTDASVLLHSQPAPNLNINSWNEIVLSSPVLIDGTDELWFGYEVSQTEGYPAGLGQGPAVAGKGDMFNWGGTWISMKNSWNYEFNWLLQGFVSESPSPFAPSIALAPVPQAQVPLVSPAGAVQKPALNLVSSASPGLFESDQVPAVIPEIATSGNMQSTPVVFTGYNIYRNNVLLADSVTDLFFDDPLLPRGHYNYEVSAQYDLGESERIGPVAVSIYTCFPPTALTVANNTLTTTSAVLSWTPSTLSTATEWSLEWGPSGFTPGTGNTAAVNTTPTYTLAGLTPGYEYDFYVTTVCSSSDSSAPVKKTFRTHYIDCPPGATAEAETCGDTTNNGCRLQIPAFESISCGDTICGKAWLLGQSFDSDWYSFTLSDTFDVTITTRADFSFRTGIKSLPCPATGFVSSVNGGPGWPTTFTVQLNPGTWYVYIAPTFNGNVSCDSLDRYTFTLSCSDCLTPASLSGTSSGGGSASLSWSSGASIWEIEWGAPGFSPGTGTVIPGVTQNPYTLTGLTDGYTYQFYVRSDCGGGVYSNRAGPASFFVPCPVTSLPFLEDFASSAVGLLPVCWQWGGAGAPTNWIVEDNSMAGGESPELSFIPWAPYFSGTSRIMSPAINTAGRSELTLSFDHSRNASNSSVTVEVLTSGDNGLTWNSVWSDNQSGNPGPVTISFTIANSDVGSSAFRLAFAVTGNSWDLNGWWIDDISLDGILLTGILEGFVTDCSGGAPLENVTVTAAGQSVSTLSYGFYQFPSIPIGTHDVTFSHPDYTGVTKTGVVITDGMTTMADTCLVSVGTPVNRIIQNVAVLNGMSVCYDAYETITVAGDGSTFVINSGGSAYMIAGLKIRYLPGTLVEAGGYMHGMIAPGGPFCGAKSTSFVNAGGQDGTLVMPVADAISVFPNPTSGKLRVETGNSSVDETVRITVYTITGEQVVSSDFTGQNSVEIDLTGRPSGIYIMRISAADRIHMVRVVVAR